MLVVRVVVVVGVGVGVELVVGFPEVFVVINPDPKRPLRDLGVGTSSRIPPIPPVFLGHLLLSSA